MTNITHISIHSFVQYFTLNAWKAEVNTTYHLTALALRNLIRNKQILYSVETYLLLVCADYTSIETDMLLH